MAQILPKKIETPTLKFDDYLGQCDTIQPDNPVPVNELKDTFFSLQINKNSGYDGISFNVFKHCFDSLRKSLLHIFDLSIQNGVFPDGFPVFPISVLPCFSKILDQIVYN